MMPARAPRPFAVPKTVAAKPFGLETPKALSDAPLAGFDPLLVLRAACFERSVETSLPELPIRRRGSLAQGQALESLGHAVEYLVDSRMFLLGNHNRAAETEAVQILMRLSRQVFAECPAVEPPFSRLRRLWAKCFGLECGAR